MIPPAFEYEVAESAEHAVDLLASLEDAKLLAGGQSLLPLMKLRFARPAALVDVGRLRELAYVRDEGERVAIGALTRQRELERDELLLEACPLLRAAAALVGDRQVRARGTIGGSVAHADPSGDLPAALLALDAELVVRGRDGERTVAARDFFHGLFETALGPQDVLVEIRAPRLPPGARSAYLKFKRRGKEWATVAVAAVVRVSDGRIEHAALALAGMGPAPLRAEAVERALAGAARADAPGAAELADQGTTPPSDATGSADYRRHLARVLVRRALAQTLA